MATNVNSFKVFVEFVSNKVQSGNTITIPEFNLVANQAQMVAFEQDFDVWYESKGKNLTQYLNTFLEKLVPLNVDSSGVGILPLDYQHAAGVRSYWIRPNGRSVQVPVIEVENIDWGYAQISSLNIPTKRFPKYTQYSNTFEFLPKDLGIAYLDYFRTPIKPVWGYTVVNDEAVYNPSTSTDFEFNEFALNRIAAIYLSLIGINLKETQLQQYALMFQQENTQQ